MNAMKRPELLDVVALLRTSEEGELCAGDVGTVVELLAPDTVEVEFLDRDGRTCALSTLNVNDLLVLNRTRTPIP